MIVMGYFKICTLSLFLFIIYLVLGFNYVLADDNKTKFEFSFKFGEKGNQDGQLMNPHSIDIDKNGIVYVTDTGNNRVQKFNSDGKFILKWGEMGSEDGQFLKLHDVVVDPSGNYVYTLELKNHRVQKFTSDGEFILKWSFEKTGGRGSDRTPHQIAIDSKGYVYLSDMNGNQILKFDDVGNFIKILGSNGTGEGQFVHPHGIVFDSNNNMYVTDIGNYRIQLYDFNLMKQWGTYGDGPDQFLKTFPGIDYFDKEKLLFVVDKTSANVKVFDSKGEFLTKFGTKGKADGQFNRPEDISVDSNGRAFITDTGNSRIEVFARP